MRLKELGSEPATAIVERRLAVLGVNPYAPKDSENPPGSGIPFDPEDKRLVRAIRDGLIADITSKSSGDKAQTLSPSEIFGRSHWGKLYGSLLNGKRSGWIYGLAGAAVFLITVGVEVKLRDGVDAKYLMEKVVKLMKDEKLTKRAKKLQ